MQEGWCCECFEGGANLCPHCCRVHLCKTGDCKKRHWVKMHNVRNAQVYNASNVCVEICNFLRRGTVVPEKPLGVALRILNMCDILSIFGGAFRFGRPIVRADVPLVRQYPPLSQGKFNLRREFLVLVEVLQPGTLNVYHTMAFALPRARASLVKSP